MSAFVTPTSIVYSIAALTLLYLLLSIRRVGPTEVGLVTKRLGWGRLSQDNPIALDREAGYQADLLMPGLRFKPWLVFAVDKYPWVQVPAGEIGVVIAQVGQPLPIGAKSAVYRTEFGNFTDLRAFVKSRPSCAARRVAGHVSPRRRSVSRPSSSTWCVSSRRSARMA